MHSLNVMLLVGFAVLALALVQPGQAQSYSGSRPASGVIFEPTISFIRQNLRLVNSYVALFRSIFVGAYERPLITSTDGPVASTRVPPPKVPPMDLPTLMAALK